MGFFETELTTTRPGVTMRLPSNMRAAFKTIALFWA
jgi:hypothetical protein